MKCTHNILGLGAGIALLSLFSACSSGSGTSANAGGGANETGGTGNASVGGDSSAGGSTSSAGGHTSAGGSSSTSPATVTPLFTFDTDLQGFTLQATPGTAPYINIGAPGASTPPVEVTWASKDYDGAAANPGSIMITATFSDWNQSVSVQVPFPTDALGNPISMVQDPNATPKKYKTIKARVFISSGLSANLAQFPGGATMYVKTGSPSYLWGQGTWNNILATGSWLAPFYDAAAPDPAGSVAGFTSDLPLGTLGIKISTNGGGTTPPAFGPALTTVIYVDQFTIQNDP